MNHQNSKEKNNGFSNPSTFNINKNSNITSKPTLESIHFEKFLKKRVLEAHNEWENITRKTQSNIKKIGLHINQNEEEMRNNMKTFSTLQNSKNNLQETYKQFNESLDKIVSNQENIQLQMDYMAC